jgi:hypothetical protein
MLSPQWLSGKIKYPLGALYSAFWWGSCALLCLALAAAIASSDLQDARATPVQSIAKRASATKSHGVPCSPADKFPQPAIFHKCGAISGCFLRPGRKPGPYNASASATLATSLYMEDNRESRLLWPIAQRGAVGRHDIYLHCCSFLI